jgi:ribosome-associated translation inhibitor RaiA
LIREEEDCENKLQEITDYFAQVNSLKQELSSQNSETEIDILLKAKARVIIGQDVNG